MFPLVLYFFLSSVVHVYCLPSYWVVFVNTRQKGGEIDEIWEILFKRFLNYFYLAGDEIFLKWGENKSFYLFICLFIYFFLCIKLRGGVSLHIYYFFVYISLLPHMR